MPFEIRQISKHGSSNPIVARLSLQVMDLIQFCGLGKAQKDEVVKVFNSNVQPRLLECDDIAREIAVEIEKEASVLEEKGLSVQSDGRFVRVPHIIRLDQRTEQFLYCAKLALRDLTGIFNIFFESTFTAARFDKVLAWAENEFGSESELALLVKRDHDTWIKKLVDMRNAVEHPGEHSGRLSIHNFEMLPKAHPEYPKVIAPTWHLNDDPKTALSPDLTVFVRNILEFSEDVLVVCMRLQGFPKTLSIVEIPEGDRNKECPVRLRVTLAEDGI